MNKIVAVCVLFLTLACQREEFQSDIPFALVDLEVNLNNQPYSDLRRQGDYLYLNAGVRGIILYRGPANAYLAFEQNCPYEPLSDCATVSVDPSGFFMIDSCCNSTFDFQGFPTGGPAVFPLRQYPTFRSENILIISNNQ